MYDSDFAKSLTGSRKRAQAYGVKQETPVRSELTARCDLLTGRFLIPANMRETGRQIIADLKRGNREAMRTMLNWNRPMRAAASLLNRGSWLSLQPRQDNGSRAQKWRVSALIAEGWKSFHRVSSMTYEIIAAKVAREVAIGCER